VSVSISRDRSSVAVFAWHCLQSLQRAVTTRLLEGALDVLRDAGVDRSDIAVGWVPGAFEVP